MWTRFLFVLLALVFFQTACDSTHKGGPDVGPGGETFNPENEANFESILNRLFLKPNCNCHVGADPDHGIALDSYEGVMDVGSGIVRPFKPLESKLYTSLRDGTMPKGNRARVSQGVLTMVRLWIEKGALNDGPDKPVDRPPPASPLKGEPCDGKKIEGEPAHVPCSKDVPGEVEVPE